MMIFSLFCVLGMALVALVSLLPSDFKRAGRTLCLYYPVPAVLLYGVYELLIGAEVSSDSVPIRIDLLLLHPLLAFIVLVAIGRWILLLIFQSGRNGEKVPGFGSQYLLILGCTLACGIWMWTRWR